MYSIPSLAKIIIYMLNADGCIESKDKYLLKSHFASNVFSFGIVLSMLHSEIETVILKDKFHAFRQHRYAGKGVKLRPMTFIETETCV